MRIRAYRWPRTWVLFGTSAFTWAAASFGQTFTITASPASLTIYPGQQNIPVAITTSSNTYTGPITVTLTGLPSGISVLPLTLSGGSSGTLTLNASVAAGQEGFPPADLPVPTSWTAAVTVIGAAGSTQVTAPLALTVSISNPAFAPAPAAIDLPTVTINTNGVPIVDKTTDVPGTITITSADGQTSYLPNGSDTDNTATFHVHGNSTALMPKLPYHIKLNTSLDLLYTMGLSCPYVTNGKAKPTCDKSKSYILLANYDDKTFLRDWAASALANAIPIGNGYLSSPADSPSPSGTSALMPWAPHSLFVELYLNGVYEGNYQLIEEVKVDSHRLNISELSESNTTPPDVTGGYLLEIDHHEDEAYVFDTPEGLPIGLIDPDFTPDPEIPEQTSYISSYVDSAEAALFSGNFTDPTQGWRAYFDEASAVNFYIVNDLMGNADGGAFQSSDYLYKDQNNPLIYMGPIWDFDISSGNINYAAIVNPTVPWMQTNSIWYAQWFKDPGFKADVVTQWNTLKNNGVFLAWLASIQQESKTLEQSQANNAGRWPMQGIQVWPDSEAAGSYDGEVAYLTEWLGLRFAYLDSLFNGRIQTSVTIGTPAGSIRAGTPVTLTAQVAGGTAPSGAISFLANGVLLGSGQLTGGAASLTTSKLPAGTVSLEAVYNGDAKNSLSASTAQPVTVAAGLLSTATSIAGPVGNTGAGSSSGFTASVIGNSGTSAPTGTLSFTVNGAAIGTASLSGNGTANFSTSNALMGGNTVQANYSGDANYQSSTSNAIVVTSDFALMASASTATQGKHESMSFQLTVTPIYGFNQPVTFACPGLQPNLSCSFSPSTVTPGSAPATCTLTVSDATNQAGGQTPLAPLWSGAGGGIVVALLLWPGKKRNVRLYIAVVAMMVSGFVITGCGTTRPVVSYAVTVSATSGNITHTSSVTATLQ